MKMKKLFTFLSVAFLIGMSVNVMAQSTGTAPYPGATHSYSVVSNDGSSYVWSVTKGDESTEVTSADLTLSPTANSASIEWASSAAVGTNYYVRVVETNNGCSNTKVIKVTPVASQFNVAVAATKTCWDDAVTVSLVNDEPSYDHGTATIAYTFTPEYNQGAYKFSYSIPTKDGFTWATPTFASGAGALETGATGNTGTFTTTGADAVTLTFVVTRTNTNNSSDQIGDQADFTSNLVISNVKTGASFNLSESTASEDVADNTQNISVSRPHTTNIVAE